tara:strand:+ start:156 stop:608 length:453 start_codon:yes stop_codon:yes gene_type:complete
MAGIVGLTELQHTNGNSMLTVATTGDGNVKSEGGAATTSLRQGLCKFWIVVSSNHGSLDDSFNCGSITDVASGQLAGNFTNNMSSTNYAQNSEMMAGFAGAVNYARWSPHTESGSRSTSQCRGTAGYEEDASTAFEDFPNAQFTVHGDLA